MESVEVARQLMPLPRGQDDKAKGIGKGRGWKRGSAWVFADSYIERPAKWGKGAGKGKTKEKGKGQGKGGGKKGSWQWAGTFVQP